jgi:diaminohydroxyphosphoribosylaminopyrimidine deaminase/5-amino-6-(5-phosphoribosylamino)uracil reductase
MPDFTTRCKTLLHFAIPQPHALGPPKPPDVLRWYTNGMDAADELWMRRALELAERGRGFVEPNPLVGAVLVRQGRIVGEGWHQRYGQAHAEVHAFAAAGEAARGATLYVTLEPCCHQGKTPPCTDAVLRAGVTRVVAALEDPFPQVDGQGAARLRAAGVAIEFGVGAAEARRQNAPYLKRLATGRPYVHAKWAMTLDGKIASRTGDSQWISNDASRRRVHELRGRMDGILVGIGTALADDPLLTARPPGPRTATRVVLDSQGRLPLQARLIGTARDVPTLVVMREGTNAVPLRAAGCAVLPVSTDEQGRPSLTVLLDALGQRQWTNLLVEGGTEVFGQFFDGGHVDEVHAFIAPKVLGGRDALPAVGGHGAATVALAQGFSGRCVEMIDGDVYLRAWR